MKSLQYSELMDAVKDGGRVIKPLIQDHQVLFFAEILALNLSEITELTNYS